MTQLRSSLASLLAGLFLATSAGATPAEHQPRAGERPATPQLRQAIMEKWREFRSQPRRSPEWDRFTAHARILPSATKSAPKVVSAEEAVRQAVRPGDRVVLAMEMGAPQAVTDALVDWTKKGPLNTVNVVHTAAEVSYRPFDPAKLKLDVWFQNRPARAVPESARHTQSMDLGQIPHKLQQPGEKPQVIAITVSKPDAHGFVYTGLSLDIIAELVADPHVKVIAVENPNMPQLKGTRLHQSHIDFKVSDSRPIAELSFGGKNDLVELATAKHAAELVPNDAILQLGIGPRQDALARRLVKRSQRMVRRGEGPIRVDSIRTELLGDGAVDLHEAGMIQGPIETGIVAGSKRLFDMVAKNPKVHMRSTRLMNDTAVVSQYDRFVAVNSGLTIGLDGDVCSEAFAKRKTDGQLAWQQFSGVGGQRGFFHAVQLGRAAGKKQLGILQLRSTAVGGTVSSIVLGLDHQVNLRNGKVQNEKIGNGALPTSTPREDVDVVATEWGTAQLSDKSARDRALGLIKIAHPRFRSFLAEQARQRFGEAKSSPEQRDVWDAAAEVTAQEQRWVKVFDAYEKRLAEAKAAKAAQ